ncbi:PREDICTED: uncharacterized protein LOC109171577 [Ipomoea nil]|uniref:uncharacterized protein LOC109171577 n=1 Tax=Ipomoea nil TaxID=35883 RepID=UPI00090139CD|nr:PREDICTED: uncharacterized protein LOC109171577 [Ipomoea nil]
METKARREKMEWVQVRMGFDGMLVVGRKGMGGGLALFWREKDMVTVLGYSANHINVSVHLPDKIPYRLTCFYGYPERARRELSWRLLRGLKSSTVMPWIVIGDFNDIASPSEKKGVNPYPDGLIRGFNDTLNYCELCDLGMVGYRFTWDRGRGTDHWLEERLDRAVGNVEWCVAFPEAIMRNILTLNSDHSAIFLDPDGSPVCRVHREFRFKAAWLLDEECKQAVERV